MKKITRAYNKTTDGQHSEDDRLIVARETLDGEELFWTNHTLLRKNVLTKDDCNKLITIMLSTEFSELDETSLEGHSIEPKDKKLLETEISWKYAHPDGKDYLNLIPDSPEFNEAMEIVMDTLPDDEQYGMVNFAQIIKYNTGTLFHWHKDIADENDSATVIFTLNGNFEGGQFNLDKDTFNIGEGDSIAFNNSTDRWHNVSPITKGERFCFAIWFGISEDDNNEQSDSEMQSMSEGTSDT